MRSRFMLVVTLALTGGIQRFVNERCRGIRSQALFARVLRPFSPVVRIAASYRPMPSTYSRCEVPPDLTAQRVAAQPAFAGG
jgi:hypothetical protein